MHRQQRGDFEKGKSWEIQILVSREPGESKNNYGP
jgi:hypothetical protein